ncbi:MAG: Na+/H+ antiporter NhaA [Acidimicrobiales bacterium]|nr:Na+/H+ antiporter NhaA [Acidimicrobiales bacterium]
MAEQKPHSSKTWLGKREPLLARRIGLSMQRFLGIEAAGGILLIFAAIIALIWANSPWSNSYFDLWNTEIHISIGDLISLEHHGHPLTLGEFINDVLMVLFFFVVGLEIKRELVTGELNTKRAAALPAAAAIGGMVVPALIYFAFNQSGDATAGWGIPMATDIAFAVGVVSLLGTRVSTSLKIFLLTLAIVDDIGAIIVIALFYTEKLSVGWLIVAFLVVFATSLLKAVKIWYMPIYVILGFILWYAIFESGVHATIAGVIMGLLAPARPLLDTDDEVEVLKIQKIGEVESQSLRRLAFQIKETVPVTERLANLLHPLTGFIILPLFALANAGVVLSTESVGDAVSSGITQGIVVGLVVGKIAGITLFTLLAVKIGLCTLPPGTTKRHIVGIASIAGIGFTVSMFIGGLAFDNAMLQDEAKIGILFASVVAAIIGTFILYKSSEREESSMEEEKLEMI